MKHDRIALLVAGFCLLYCFIMGLVVILYVAIGQRGK